MAKEKKKQHYVPQCYLENWTSNDSKQVYAFDKMAKRSFCTNTSNIAAERYFYDIDFSKVLSEEEKQKFVSDDIDLEKLSDEQYIENYLANSIEGEFKTIINSIVNRVCNMNAWEVANCFGIDQQNKAKLSWHLSVLTMRGIDVRSGLLDTSDCLEQIFTDMGASEQTIKKYSLRDSDLPFIQGRMIIDSDELHEMASTFFNLTWVLLINKTKTSVYTSDKPIGRISHVEHPFLSMAGLTSPGIEVYFPLSPELILLMYDGKYHNYSAGQDRTISSLNKDELIYYYNYFTVVQSQRWVISNNNDFSLITEMVSEKPDIFNAPSSVVSWGGKTYVPRNKSTKTQEQNNA